MDIIEPKEEPVDGKTPPGQKKDEDSDKDDENEENKSDDKSKNKDDKLDESDGSSTVKVLIITLAIILLQAITIFAIYRVVCSSKPFDVVKPDIVNTTAIDLLS